MTSVLQFKSSRSQTSEKFLFAAQVITLLLTLLAGLSMVSCLRTSWSWFETLIWSYAWIWALDIALNLPMKQTIVGLVFPSKVPLLKFKRRIIPQTTAPLPDYFALVLNMKLVMAAWIPVLDFVDDFFLLFEYEEGSLETKDDSSWIFWAFTFN